MKTDSEGHARRYVEELETLPSAILCAGGDGTLSEIVTGRRKKTKFIWFCIFGPLVFHIFIFQLYDRFA